MSKCFEVLQQAGRDKELIQGPYQSAPHSNGRRPAPSLEGLAQEEVTKLVQRVFLLPSNGTAPRAVVFCGMRHSEASTRICARAGQALAKQGMSTVCLVDANLRSPSLHTHFGVENGRGLVNALFQAGPVCDFAQPLAGANLWIVPSGRTTPDVYARLGGELMQGCLAELCAQFRYVLIDAPPVDLYADAAVVGKLADGVVLVVEANSTRRETTKQVKENLDTANVKILGAVLDKRTFPIPEALYRRL